MVCIICMVGNDYQRILDGVYHWARKEQVESVYLFYDFKRDKYGYISRRNVEDLSYTFSSLGLKPYKVGCNPQNFEDIFCTVYRILDCETREHKRTVLIDTTSTTKEAYGAIVTVSLMFPNVRIYIIPPKERGWYVPSPRDRLFEEWFQKTRRIPGLAPVEIFLPSQRLGQPNSEEKLILDCLREHGGSCDSLISLIKWCGGRTDDPATKTRFSRIVSRLERRGFVETGFKASRKHVSLTTFGSLLARALAKKVVSES